MKQAFSPWTGDIISAEKCWACGETFKESDTVKVVDAADPKLVHNIDLCIIALTPLAVGG